MVNKRQSNIEALRAVAMFLIVVYHYIFYGLKNNPSHQYYDMTSWRDIIDYVTMEPFYIISGISVNCYVMITGYFLIEKTKFRWRGGINVWIQTLFYSLLFLFIWKLFVDDDMTRKELLQSFFPIYNSSYWFVTSYMGLLTISPFLSIMAQQLDKRQFQILLTTLFCLNFEYLFGTIFSGARTIMWFSFLFLLSGYIRIHGIPIWINRFRFYLMAGIMVIMFVIGSLVNIAGTGSEFHLVSTNYNGFLFFLSVIVFICFLSFDTRNKWVQPFVWISPYTFGVYLVHSNFFVQSRIWTLTIPDYFVYPEFIYCLSTSIGIFVVCILIDYVRHRLFEIFKVNDIIRVIAQKIPQL